VRVNATGEQVCGDDWAAAMRTDRVALMMADGLGHGIPAHDAARQAVAAYKTAAERSPSEAIQDIHAALHGTRGAAVTAIAIDLQRGIVQCSGVGNVAAVVLPPGGARMTLLTHNGTAGHGVLRTHDAQYPFPIDALLVLHTDGLQSQWDLGAYPGLRTRDPSLIAGVLYRDYSRRRDDVTVVVVKDRTRAGGM
jgi:serine phosphatase RsbU (regulator of sigma subunit)